MIVFYNINATNYNMPNAYSTISIPEGNNFTKGGVFILANPSISNSLTTILNPELNENCVLVSCSPSQSINNWGKGLSNNVKEILVSYWKKLTPESVKIALEGISNKIKRKVFANEAKTIVLANGMLRYFLTNFDNYCKKNGGSLKDIPMDIILGIESVRNDNIDKYPSHCFGYFGGSKKDNDESLYENCMREATEESNIIFDESILSIEYQTSLRTDIGYIPFYVDTQFGTSNMFSRVYVILLGSDIKLINQPDGKVLAKIYKIFNQKNKIYSLNFDNKTPSIGSVC